MVLRSGKEILQCTIFERWIDTDSGCAVHCGDEATAEAEKTTGISEKSVETIEASVESSIGITGLAQLKSQLKGVLGYEVNWNKSVTTKMTYPCKAPKCGSYELTIYQLVRDYELTYFRRGSWPFKSDVWDRKWTKTITEETEKYDAVPDRREYDERCQCSPKDSPDYDGRLCFDFGDLSLRVPYKLTPEGFTVRLAEHVVSFTFTDYSAGIRRLDDKLNISVPTKVIPEPLLFLSGIEGAEIEATVYKYVDLSSLPSMAVAENLILETTFQEIRRLPAEAKL